MESADRKGATRFSSGAAERSDVPRAGLQAAAAATGTVSCLLVLAVAPARVGWWIGLPGATFCAHQLPQEHQRLARNMLKMRRKRGWEAMHPSSSTLDYFVQHGDNIWRVTIPVAQQKYERLSALPEGHPQRGDGMERPARVVQNEMLSPPSSVC